MSKPLRHAISSSKIFGGVPEDFISIHDFMDSSKGAFADNRHRALTHNSWFIAPQGPLERSFGTELLIPRRGSEEPFAVHQGAIERHQREIQYLRSLQRQCAHVVSVRDVGEQHVLEDFQGKFIPNPSDFLTFMEFHAWMQNGQRGLPPSMQGASKNVTTKTIKLSD